MTTMPLYSRNGAMPAALPSICYDERNWSYTAPYAPDDLAMLGFVFFADVDLTTHRVVADGSGWKVEAIPAPEPEPEPEPQPITLTADEFFLRLTDDEYDALDAAIRTKESKRIVRLWDSPSLTLTEGGEIWTVVAKHLGTIVTPERKAEILAASTGQALVSDTTTL